MHAPLARAMTEMFLLASLALLSRVPSIGSFSDGEYIWSSGSSGQGNCVEIPEDLRLCYGVGYRHMLLPNLLEHDSMAEVKQQASSWVPLVHRRCHPGTQVSSRAPFPLTATMCYALYDLFILTVRVIIAGIDGTKPTVNML